MPVHRLVRVAVSSLALAALIAGCRAIGGASGSSPEEQRSTIRSEQSTALGELYAAHPSTKDKIKNAVGHGYFSNMNVNLLVLSTEGGYGVVHDSKSGKDTFMKMAAGGVGLGMGVKDYRAIFIFTDPNVMHKFVESGWDFSGQADATAKADKEGGAAGAGATGSSVAGVEVYQFTKTGIALQATVHGTKYWRDDKLNN